MTRLTDLNQNKEKRKIERISIIGDVAGIFIIGLVLGILIFGKEFDYCEHIADIKLLDFNGVVHEKVDNMWDHGSHGLDIKTIEAEIIYLSLAEDDNRTNQRLWKIVSEGDSIKKHKNEFFIWIKGKNENWKKTKLVFSETQCRN